MVREGPAEAGHYEAVRRFAYGESGVNPTLRAREDDVEHD